MVLLGKKKCLKGKLLFFIRSTNRQKDWRRANKLFAHKYFLHNAFMESPSKISQLDLAFGRRTSIALQVYLFLFLWYLAKNFTWFMFCAYALYLLIGVIKCWRIYVCICVSVCLSICPINPTHESLTTKRAWCSQFGEYSCKRFFSLRFS